MCSSDLVFFQYAPFDVNGGIKMWGHYQSKDLINWSYQGVPFVNDLPEDKDGVYSGSAFVEDDTVYLYYTGNEKEIGDHDYIYSGRKANTVLITSKDMQTFSEKKCLMSNKDYGDELSCHVRDPKVWKADGKYYMVQGARRKDDVGEILVFESADKVNWQRINVVSSKETFGYMWECPDYFEIGEDKVLLLSPQGLEAEGLNYQNQYQSGYFLVEGDIRREYTLGAFRELDRGFDFYAPQTFEDEKGRRILIAWVGVPDCDYTNPTVAKGWQHTLSLPRELKIIDGKIYQLPLVEYQGLRQKKSSFTVVDKAMIMGCATAEIVVTNIKGQEDFRLTINEDVCLSYSADAKVFALEFLNHTGYGRDKRGVALDKLESLRIFKDHSMLEVFVNEGEEVFTTRYYPEKSANEIVVEHLLADVTVWELGEMNDGI